MASKDPNPNRTPMYPEIDPYSPSAPPLTTSSSSSSLYPKVEMNDLVQNLFPDSNDGNTPRSQCYSPSAPPESTEDSLVTIPGAILHLIDKHYSVELATGDLQILSLRQGDNTVAAVASISDDIQWPLTKDLAAVKLDSSHYFFSFRAPRDAGDSDSSDEDDKKKKKKRNKKDKKRNKKESKEENDVLSYGLTIVSIGQEELLKQLDAILEAYSNFSVQKVEEKALKAVAGVNAGEITAKELKSDEKKKEEVEGQCAAYWTTLAPNVEEYSGTAARLIAKGSGQLVKGILWCGDVTMERLKWGDEVLRQRMAPGNQTEIDPATLKRIKRVKRVTKMTEKVATGVLSGVIKVSGFFTESVANSRVGKKVISLVPGEIILASLDGFSKVCDAVEVAGKNVMETSSTVTTGLVNHRYGEEAAKAASEGMDAAGHAVGAAWAVFKIRQALNPKSVLKPTSLAKSAAQDLKQSVSEKMAKGSK